MRQRGLITQPQRNGDEPGDAELAERAAGGEVAAFEILYRRHAEAAWRVAQAVTGNTHDAADAVSDAFTRVFQALPQRLRDGGHFRPYLLASTRNAAIDVLRRNGRTSPTETDQIDRPAVGNEPAELVMDDADSTMVTRAFRSLPERWRSVLWLTEVEGIPPREAAALLGLSPNGVAQLAVRARTGLRERFLQAHLSGAEVLAECRFTVERLGAYVAGGLPPRDVAKVDQHLAGCPACTGRRAQLAEITPALLRRAALPLPAGLAALVAARWDLGAAGTGAAAAGGAGAAGTAVAGAGVSAGGGVAAGGGAVAAGAGAGGAAGAGAAAALVPAAGGLAAAGAGTALVSAASLALLVAGVVGAGVVGNAPEPPAAVAPATPPAGAAARQAPTGPAPAPVPAPTAAPQGPAPAAAGGGLLAGLAPPAGPALPGPRVPVALGGVVGSPNQPVTQVVDVVTSVTGVPGNAVPVPGTSLLDVVASLAPGDQACPGVRILVLTAGCPPVVPPAPVGAAPPAELPRGDGPAAPLAPALPAPTPAPAPAITPPGGGLLSALTAPLAGASLLDGLLGDGLLGDGLLGDGLLGDGVPGTGFLRPVPPLPPAGG